MSDQGRASLEELAVNPRVTVRRGGAPDPAGRCVVYWMQRAQRGRENAALDVAIDAANALGLPIVTFFGLIPGAPGANLRHYQFMIDGLPDVQAALRARGVGFVVRRHPEHEIERFASEVRAVLIIGDENPLRQAEAKRCALATAARVPVWTVDADVIVPWRQLEKEQYSARTIRPRLHRLLPRFLVATREPVAVRRWRAPPGLASLAPTGPLLDGLPIDRSVAAVAGAHGGAAEGASRLRQFVLERLAGYHFKRNRPELDATSRLSPYIHFGHLGPATVARAVAAAEAPAEDKAALLEELIVRRELAVNFVRFNPSYDRLAGCERWAKETLRLHGNDPRPVGLPASRLEAAESPDPLWNAAQRQLLVEGWMHGYLRMYWAKKILEWSDSPEEAFARAIEWNDRWQLDGRDPNGYAGIAWAIGGKHDRAWGPERPIYGKIRFMSLQSTSRKFDWRAYRARVEGCNV